MRYEELIEFSWRVYEISIATAEILGWLGVIIGGIGLLMTRTKPSRYLRYRGLFVGGVAGLIALLIVGDVYEAITLVMTDQTGRVDHVETMYPDIFLERMGDDMSDVLIVTGLLSQVAAIVGMAAFVFGVAFWGFVKQRSVFKRKSKRIIYSGIALMVVSVSERLFSAGIYVLISAFAAN